MKPRFAMMLALGLLLPAVAASADTETGDDAENPIADLDWAVGPTVGEVGTRGTFKLPDGYAFLDSPGAHKLDALMHNPAPEGEEYVVAPLDMKWVAYLSFNEVGYVKDDEKVDAADVLESLREGTEQSNEERKRNGWESLHVVGWSSPPKFDPSSKALEWAVLLEDDSKSRTSNFNTRVLGRKGVVEVTLAASPEDLDASIADFRKVLPGYEFKPGEKYSEFKAGDHVAEFGLAALITGGAVAVAAKKGVFAALIASLGALWKFILMGLVAVGAAVKKFFGRKDPDKR